MGTCACACQAKFGFWTPYYNCCIWKIGIIVDINCNGNQKVCFTAIALRPYLWTTFWHWTTCEVCLRLQRNPFMQPLHLYGPFTSASFAFWVFLIQDRWCRRSFHIADCPPIRSRVNILLHVGQISIFSWDNMCARNPWTACDMNYHILSSISKFLLILVRILQLQWSFNEA